MQPLRDAQGSRGICGVVVRRCITHVRPFWNTCPREYGPSALVIFSRQIRETRGATKSFLDEKGSLHISSKSLAGRCAEGRSRRKCVRCEHEPRQNVSQVPTKTCPRVPAAYACSLFKNLRLGFGQVRQRSELGSRIHTLLGTWVSTDLRVAIQAQTHIDDAGAADSKAQGALVSDLLTLTLNGSVRRTRS